MLIALNRRFTRRSRAGLPPYDEARLLAEAALLVDWYLPAVTGSADADRTLRADYLALWRALLPLARGVPETLVLRDYHVDNLMRLPGRAGIAACGLLDFQDAVLGPLSYDLVSLLEDARRDVPADLAAAMRARFLAAFPGARPRRLRRAPMPCWARSAIARSSASSRGFACATASPPISRTSRASGGSSSRICAHPALAPLARLARSPHPARRGAFPQPGPPHERRARNRHGARRRARHAHAADHRPRAEAAGRRWPAAR